MTTLVLAVVGLVLAGLAPWVLTALPALRRTPRATMTLWQASALAAVLAVLAVPLSWGAERPVGRHATARLVVVSLSLVVTLVVLARLLLTGHRVGTRIRALRRRQARLVDLLAVSDQGVTVIPHPTPMAYCLPGLTTARVVVSQAVCDRLAPEELAAVLAHERAHLRARHDLVIEAFTVLHTAFPRLGSSASALAEVRLLVEVLADRSAVRRVGTLPLARALVAVSGGATPESALGAAGDLRDRLALLRDSGAHRLQAGVVYASAIVVLLVPVLLVVGP